MSWWHTNRPLRAGICALAVSAGIAATLVLRHLSNSLPAVSPRPPLPFQECAEEAGIRWQMRFLAAEQGENFKINLYDHGCGLAVGDFDGDGREDLYFCNQLGPNALYRNNGDGTFTNVAAEAGVALGDRVCVAATFADYDNDGRPDLFVTSTRGGNVLFRNLGNGKFEDVTRKAGLVHVAHSQTAVFFDFDNDGYLDLFLANTAQWTGDKYDSRSHHWLGPMDLTSDLATSRREQNVLYRNNGNGTFTDVTTRAGLQGLGWAGDAVAFDYDGDGHMDLFVTNMFGRSQLYRNNGAGAFADVTQTVLGRTSWGSVGAKVFDFNNDGRLDLYVVDMHSDMWTGLDWTHANERLARKGQKKRYAYLRGPLAERERKGDYLAWEIDVARRAGWDRQEVVFGNTFYQNDGAGKFTEISQKAGLETFWPWGIAVGDFDNDGFEDVFLPSGMGFPFWYWPNCLLMNRGDGTFRNRAEELGIEPPPRGRFFPEKVAGRQAARSSRCAVTGDFRGCGQLDIVTNNFNDQPYYFKNQLPPKNYIAFRLQGTLSNRDAVGAVIRLYQGAKLMTRQVPAACGYLSHSSRTLHFGLGDLPRIDRVEITWPRGKRQTIIKPSANRRHDIVEPALP